MDTAQNLKSSQEVVENITVALWLSLLPVCPIQGCSETQPLWCLTVVLSQLQCRFLLASTTLSSPYKWAGKWTSRSVSPCIHPFFYGCPNSSAWGQRQNTWELNQSFMQAERPLRGCLVGSCTRRVFCCTSFYLVLLHERRNREGKSLFFWICGYLWSKIIKQWTFAEVQHDNHLCTWNYWHSWDVFDHDRNVFNNIDIIKARIN